LVGVTALQLMMEFTLKKLVTMHNSLKRMVTKQKLHLMGYKKRKLSFSFMTLKMMFHQNQPYHI
jgi:hypothetical protein